MLAILLDFISCALIYFINYGFKIVVVTNSHDNSMIYKYVTNFLLLAVMSLALLLINNYQPCKIKLRNDTLKIRM